MIAPVITPAWMGTMSGREEKADEERSKRTEMEKWQWKANARLKSGVFIRKKTCNEQKKKKTVKEMEKKRCCHLWEEIGRRGKGKQS